MVISMRFEVKKCDNEYCVFDNDDDMNVVAVCDVERISQKTCELLNMLHEENIELKQSIVDIAKEYSEQEIENEQLKHQLATLDGLYCSDKEDMNEVFRLDLQKFL